MMVVKVSCIESLVGWTATDYDAIMNTACALLALVSARYFLLQSEKLPRKILLVMVGRNKEFKRNNTVKAGNGWAPSAAGTQVLNA